MKVAIIGSRNLEIEIPEEAIPKSTEQIISGSAEGIDRKARTFAEEHHIQILEILPDYQRYQKSAPLKRNDDIIEMSDMVIAFWDGKSRGTKYVIDKCRQLDKPIKIYTVTDNEE